MNKELFMAILFLCFLGACASDASQGKDDLKKQASGNQGSIAQSTELESGSKMPDIDKSMKLPKSLDEISGLTYDASANVLIGNNDELGVLYFLDFEKGKVKAELKIGDIGDYEGVEMVGDKIYLINSAGELLEHVIGQEGSSKKSTELTANNNVEGLAFFNNQLLIACKGSAELNEYQQFPGCRSIYAYSLLQSKLNNLPLMLINYAMLESAIRHKPSPRELKRLNEFAPSGIAIHPKTQDIYMLSFEGGLLVVCNAQAMVKKVYFLDQDDHRQPEGICFDKENRLYIANEGNGHVPVIHRYQF